MSDQRFESFLTATEPEPRTRIRVNHSRTIKEGWGYETTVEVEFSGTSYEADTQALDRLGVLLNESREIAIRERDLRNAESPMAS